MAVTDHTAPIYPSLSRDTAPSTHLSPHRPQTPG